MTHNLGSSQNQSANKSSNFSKTFTENPSESFTESLSKLKNNELHLELQNQVAEERKLTHQILLLIAEIDQRKLYLPMACSSLFEYLVKVIRYSPASAQRRIDAARLMQQVPELGKKIEDGHLKLTQVSQVQQALIVKRKNFWLSLRTRLVVRVN